MLLFGQLKFKYKSANKIKPLIQSNQYAQIAHTRPIVVPRYDEPPRTITAETRSVLETGRRRCLKMRKPYGSKKRIPALLMIAQKDPIYLSLNPAQIKTFLVYDHFLGKRYNLTVDENTTYEVIPQHIGVNPVNREPESVTFSLWTGTAPKPVLTLEQRRKSRGWETAYLNEMRLKQDLKFTHDALKAKLESLPGLSMYEDPELLNQYKPGRIKERRENFATLMDEVYPMLHETWKNPAVKVMELDKEERYPDDPHDEKDEDDEGAAD